MIELRWLQPSAPLAPEEHSHWPTPPPPRLQFRQAQTVMQFEMNCPCGGGDMVGRMQWSDWQDVPFVVEPPPAIRFVKAGEKAP